MAPVDVIQFLSQLLLGSLTHAGVALPQILALCVVHHTRRCLSRRHVCTLTPFSWRRLALLWVAAHALSAADRSYLISLLMEAIAAVSSALSADLGSNAKEPAQHTGPRAATTAIALRTAQHAVLAGLTAAVEQMLSSGATPPAAWAIHSIQCLVQVSMIGSHSRIELSACPTASDGMTNS